MKQTYSSQLIETISLEVESSPVWEVILGIAGYTHARIRHTFDLDEKWLTDQSSMPTSLIDVLQVIQETNFWYGLLMLQNRFSSSSVSDFSNHLYNLSADCIYETLLPYGGRELEPLRKKAVEAAAFRHSLASFEEYATHFYDHDYLCGYIRSLARYSREELCVLFIEAITEWHSWISQQEEWEKWNKALSFEQKQHDSLDVTRPAEEIERITDGVRYQPEPSIWTVKLIPHVSYRPWVLEKRTSDTKLFFYPLRDEYLLEPGIPPTDLVRGHKALGDELRLRLLYQLLRGPSSLQEMSTQFNISKTTLHHQLSLLKAAKFIKVDKGIYSANPTQFTHFSRRLTQYLGDDI